MPNSIPDTQDLIYIPFFVVELNLSDDNDPDAKNEDKWSERTIYITDKIVHPNLTTESVGIPTPDGVARKLIPSVEKFEKFDGGNLSVEAENSSSNANLLGKNKSLSMTVFDPYGHFWRKFFYNPLYLSTINARVFLCILKNPSVENSGATVVSTIYDTENVKTKYDCFTELLFFGGIRGIPSYEFDSKTFNLIIESDPRLTKDLLSSKYTFVNSKTVGYVPSLDDISLEDVNHIYYAALLNKEMWPDLYGSHTAYRAVPLLKPCILTTSEPMYFMLSTGSDPTKFYLPLDNNNEVVQTFLQAIGKQIILPETSTTGSIDWVNASTSSLRRDKIFLISGAGSSQPFEFKVLGRFRVMDTNTGFIEGGEATPGNYNMLTSNWKLLLEINPQTINPYWYTNIPCMRINPPEVFDLNFGVDATHFLQVAEPAKIRLGPIMTGASIPYLKNMWVRCQMEQNENVAQFGSEGLEFTSINTGGMTEQLCKVIEQQGDVCTLSYIGNYNITMIKWAARTQVGNVPTTLPAGTQIRIFSDSGADTIAAGGSIDNAGWGNYNAIKGIFIIDSKASSEAYFSVDTSTIGGDGSVEINPIAPPESPFSFDLHKVQVPSDDGGFELIPSCAFTAPQIQKKLGIAGFSFWLGALETAYDMATGGTFMQIRRAHPACTFMQLDPTAVDGFTRYLDGMNMWGNEERANLFIHATTHTETNYIGDLKTCPYSMPNLYELIKNKRQLVSATSEAYGSGVTPADRDPRKVLDLSISMRETQMTDVEAMNHIALYWGKLNIYPGIITNYTLGQFSVHGFNAYPVNFVIQEQKDVFEALSEIAWQKGKAVRERVCPTYIKDHDFNAPVNIYEVVDLYQHNKNIYNPKFHWQTGNTGFLEYTQFMTFNWGDDPDPSENSLVFHEIKTTRILNNSIRIFTSPYQKLLTNLSANVLYNNGHSGFVSFKRNTGYYGTTNYTNNYYAYHDAQTTIGMLYFWLHRLSKPKMYIEFNTTLDYKNLTIYDIVKFKLGKIHFKTIATPENGVMWAVPPPLRNTNDLANNISFVFGDGYKNGVFPIFNEEEVALTDKYICGRIMGRSIDPEEGYIRFIIEIENILGADNQAHLGLYYDLSDFYQLDTAATIPNMPKNWDPATTEMMDIIGNQYFIWYENWVARNTWMPFLGE